MLRTPVGKRWFRQQIPAVSDITMARGLYQMQLVQLRQNLLDSCHLGVVDGRKFNLFFYRGEFVCQSLFQLYFFEGVI